ncbi:IS30 family transposase [Nocardia sp. NPDC057227]|uniref:IS30 family transposase n=1 Tax=Nocardia sp. NPDC057227 TaxID=3346056 RepID=UPI00364483D3
MVEVWVRDYGLSAAQQDELWRRWRAGESFGSIGREMAVPFQHVRRFLAQSGGVQFPMRRRSARHLSLVEREEISRGIAAGESARSIARRLQRPASTIAREIARNGGRSRYRAASADAEADRRARRSKPCKLAASPVLRAVVEQRLTARWSPQQIAGWLRLQSPVDPAMQISHEAIYRTLFDPRRRGIDRTLTRQLRTARLMRHPKRARRPDGRGVIADLVPISQRPAEVEDRRIPGHWEGDLVMGRRPSAIATLVERTSRLTVLVALPDGIKAAQVTPHLVRHLLGLPTSIRRTLTWDRGREIAGHRLITAATGMPIYLCRARSPWQRGTNENTNRLLRQYLAKNADLRQFNQTDLDAIAAELNQRPRRIHGYRSPAEVYAEHLNSGDALTT